MLLFNSLDAYFDEEISFCSLGQTGKTLKLTENKLKTKLKNS